MDAIFAAVAVLERRAFNRSNNNPIRELWLPCFAGMVRSNSYSMRKTQGFTLIELLVVIAIIGILMSLLFPAVNGAIEAAKKAKAKNDVTQIAVAVRAYLTEYGKLPTTTTSPDNQNEQWVDGNNNNTIFDVLRGVLDNPLNPRKITFIECKTAKGTPPKDGVATNGVFYDPWGNAYALKLDTGYDNQIEYYGKYYSGPVLVITPGKDKTLQDPSTNKVDDIYSFQ